MKLDQLYARYKMLLHAMQSGVAFDMETGGGRNTEPKHLRTGINAAMSDHGALVTLLIEKGVFTEEEYAEKLVLFAEREVDHYETMLSDRLNRKVTLE